MIITLDGERPKSWNNYYAGTHWAKRRAHAAVVHELVGWAVLEQHPDVEPFQSQVRITVRAYFKNRPLDSDNITTKLYIDGLLGKVLVDDSPRYVLSTTSETRVDKENPRVEIEIVEV